jgi:mannose-6-phosphate isomerase-like protein (cupin superfamily)
MPFSVDSLVTDSDWIPMSLAGQQESPTYFWEDGGLLKDAPVDFDATFAENMWVSTKPIQFLTFYRNPLKVVPNFVVPRHLHNIDETIIVFKGEYKIQFGDPAKDEHVIVKPGCFFTSRAGTPYTMTAGPEGVTYIETWGTPVTSLKTVWYDFGWVRRLRPSPGGTTPRTSTLILPLAAKSFSLVERKIRALDPPMSASGGHRGVRA